MKRKKVITVTVLAMTFATMMASCGKATETVNAESVQATEQIVLETETEEIPQVSADQGEGSSLTLEPTMVDGQLIYPDYPEEYIKYTPIDPVELWCIKDCTAFENPNSTKGELVNGGSWQAGNSGVFDATCEVDGTKFYRTEANSSNLYLIIPAECLQDVPPEETTDSSETSEDAEFQDWLDQLEADGLTYDPGDASLPDGVTIDNTPFDEEHWADDLTDEQLDAGAALVFH